MGESVTVHKTNGRRDQVDNAIKTACGIRSQTGGVGELNTWELSPRWSFVTCAKCKRRQVAGVSPAMLRVLRAAARGPIYGAPPHTKRALGVRGLLSRDEVTDDGRAYLASRKRGRK